jgi:hypothetical protein
MENGRRSEMPGLDELQRALASGDLDRIRRAVLQLDAREQRVLEARLGADEVEQITRRVRRARRAARLGKVVVIPGIMGSRLDSVDPGGDADRIWVSYLRLARGRIEELRLLASGAPANPRHRIQVAGLFPEYLSLVTELAEHWDVLPFAFDWRKDIDVSADQLAAEIQRWSAGAPVHVVAHSMGGLVARRMIQRQPQLWKSMADGSALARGGRLVMLGTPNRGSFAIPLVLTGEEKTVKLLQALDLHHGRAALLGIVGTFIGSYQMLPSPLGEAVDDRAQLYLPRTWGDLPVVPAHLASAQAFHRELDVVVDPGRLLYVAGYDQRTPFRIKVEAPGRFRYQETLDGDGRVPHELGLLGGVSTSWVNEVHGDLPRNVHVLAGVHELLERGMTNALLRERPARRGVETPEWRDPADVEGDAADLLGPELLSLLRPGKKRGGARGAGTPPELDAEVAARIEALLVRDHLGSPRGAVPGALPGAVRSARARGAAQTPTDVPRLRVRVRWGDITRVPASVYAVGHYQGVLPQNAELALDRAISGDGAGDQNLVLTRLTRRGMLRGALGDVSFFPILTGPAKGRVVTVAGMGHPGTFAAPELRRLSRTLAAAISTLPSVRTVATVLIGGGVGALPVGVATEGFTVGFADGLHAATRRSDVRELVFVELQLDKAYAIHAALEALRARPEMHGRIALDVAPIDVPRDGARSPGVAFCRGLTLAAAAAAARSADGGARRALDALLASSRELSPYREATVEALRAIQAGDGTPLAKLAADLAVGPAVRRGDEAASVTRLSFVRQADAIVAAALTDTVVKPERAIRIAQYLIDGLVREMTDPEPARVPELAQRLGHFTIPRDFRELVSRGRPTIFEVDRKMAAIHWEMLASRLDAESVDGEPLALAAPVARQLRTSYSPPPSAAPPQRWPLRALVVGDPGGPGDTLEGASEEVLAVAEVLRAKGVEVELLVGAPSLTPAGRVGMEPAALYAVVTRLVKGGYDLLHYAGHAGFDEANPERAGWLFEGGLLTAAELEIVDVAPRLVVANACLTGRLSGAFRGGASGDGSRLDADLLPGLADAFFSRGVRNYVGTAWEVNDSGAVQFATVFYETLLSRKGKPTPIGEALLAARKALKAEERRFGTLWAAYQHYGDPFQTIVPPEALEDAAGARASRRGRAAAADASPRLADRVPTRRAAKRPARRRDRRRA